MYETLLESSLIVRLLVVLVPLALVVVPCTFVSLRYPNREQGDLGVMAEALKFVGAAFIFIGSFANVTAWQGADKAIGNLKNELSALSSLAESILDYEPQQVLTDGIRSINTYVEAVRDNELNQSANDGVIQAASADKRTLRTKNAALNVTSADSNEIEQAALDVRNAILNIEKADVVNERDLTRMLAQVAQFQDARRDRISARWPLVSDVVMVSLLVVTFAAVVVFGLYPAGRSRALKWLQVTTCSLVVAAIWFAVLSTQNLTMSNTAVSVPINSFLARYK